MPQVTIALSVHRPEMTPFIADQMRRHEAIFLEEPPDPGLTDEMRHFFSDYQHITRQFYKLNQKMDQLQEIDKDHQAKLYHHHQIDEILKQFDPQRGPGETA